MLIIIIAVMELEIMEDRRTIWHRIAGEPRADRIRRSQRRAIARFVIQHSKALPVTVKLDRLDRRRPFKIYVLVTGDVFSIGLTYSWYFIVLKLDDVSSEIRNLLSSNGI